MASTSGDLIHIIDDDDAIRKSLEFLLRTAGYGVKLWADGGDFLAGADKSIPACVLLDLRMPRLSGFEVQKQMAAQGFEFPVIMLTGHGDIALAVQAIMAGATDFMQKPVDREKLLAAIAAGFERLRVGASLRDEQAWAGSQLARLTKREYEVLDGLACGYPNKTIAHDLGLSSRTVEVYRATLMSKLQVSYFADALRIAFKGGLGAEKDWRDKYGVGKRLVK